MGRIPEDILDSIRRATDLGALIGRYVPLKKSGKAMSGRCPFHQEKSPSFYVWTEPGIWKCFGCGVGGNAFTFLMQKEGLRFFEAVRELARAAGITLPEDDDPEAVAREARLGHLREVTEWACKHFQNALKSPEGEAGRSYFKRRGISGSTARDFRLGYAPPGWDVMILAAHRDGIPEQDLFDAGMIIQREGKSGHYDRFRDRVIFPISDQQGRVIAFGARTLGADEPKYLNSPETPIYTKGKHLYAFHLAKHEILRSGEAAVMEGYTDVLLAHQYGYKVAVAGLGTALTPDQAKKLAQYAKKLWLIYDGDAAGLRAAEKAIPAFLPEPIETRVCVLPGGKDPADVFVQDGAESFRVSLAASREAFDHLLDVRGKAQDLTSVPGKTAAVESCLAALVGVQDEIRRALYVKRLAEEFGVPPDIAARKLDELRLRAQTHERDVHARRRPEASGGTQGPSRAAPRPADHSSGGAGSGSGSGSGAGRSAFDDGPPIDALHANVGDPGGDHGGDHDGFVDHGAGAPVDALGESVPEAPQGPPPQVERQFIEALLGAPELLQEVPVSIPDAMFHRACRRLLERLLAARDALDDAATAPPAPTVLRSAAFTRPTVVDIDRLLGTMDDPVLASLGAELRASSVGKQLLGQGRDCMRRLVVAREERHLREELKGTDNAGEEDDLLRRLQAHHAKRAGK
ncbi:MAG: DNA primase [Planctomycetes bacterium]|nr:DNA primase [Planctomycetota bacterium]